MELFTLLLLVTLGVFVLKSRERTARVALLGGYLRQYQIEKLMGALTEGYMRVLGEKDEERRTQVWRILETTERNLSEQLRAFAQEFAQVDGAQTRVSTFALALPYADRWMPSATFDLREALRIHARGVAAAVSSSDDSADERRRQAYTMTAELYLLQHTCHWYCRSATVASVRLVARHKTSYEQVLAGVSPATREAYRKLTGI
jgi:hypothetical protein